jgi:hypothetical protein
LWDGEDRAGRGTCGIFEFGICKQCGARCARFHDDQSFVPTEEQWQSFVKERQLISFPK